MTDERYFVCNDDIEYCATDQIFTVDPVDATPYYFAGAAIFIDLLFPLIYYWVRMGVRATVTGTMNATNMVDIASLFLWVFSMITFLAPFGMFPFHWLGNSVLDWTMAWYMVYIIADVLPAISIIFWFFYLIVAIGAGGGSESVCDSNGLNCSYNKSYVSDLDAWLTWFFYTIVAGAQYFVMFYFGADAVRYLAPGGGYTLKYLYPTVIYELLVVLQVAPDSGRKLTHHSNITGEQTTSDTTSAVEEPEENNSPFVDVNIDEVLLIDF